MFKIKKIQTMKFLSKNAAILFVFISLMSCSRDPVVNPVSVYCSVISEKLLAFSRLSNFEKQKFQELSETRLQKYKNDFIEPKMKTYSASGNIIMVVNILIKRNGMILLFQKQIKI